ncbi:MAG: 50S ribosomal protein L4 [Candidatus Saelkia tenebricola]|nr:50S ribosomal protein L4 [Candidatus Saelkia tenebricola]
MNENALKIDVLNMKGKKVDSVELDKNVFDGKVNKELLYQVINAYLANRRQGTHSTKTRGEVSGGGAKPWRQKGTGRARVGSNRSPIWRGGGTVFGPKPRDYSVNIPKKMKRLALKSSLNAKLQDQELMLIEGMELSEPKTKHFMDVVNNLGLEKMKSLFVLSGVNDNTILSSRNISNVFIADAKDVTAYDVLNCKKVVIVKNGLNEIIDRIKKI